MYTVVEIIHVAGGVASDLQPTQAYFHFSAV